nr:prolyl oligopeptidase family serine peptidase [Shewanella psychrotolerans]
MITAMVLVSCQPPSNKQEIDARSGRIVADYGSWRSVVTANDVYGPSDNITALQSVNDAIYFTQSDAEQEGQVALYRMKNGDNVVQVIDASFDVRSRVHEYGGAPFLGIGQSVFAVNYVDQRVYRIAPNQQPVAITPEDTRHADCVSFPKGSRVICVREDHRHQTLPKASIVALNLNFVNEGQTLVSGKDFYAAPRISPDNKQIAWISWQQPNMPWDNTELWMADIDAEGVLTNERQLLKGYQGAITQPLFSPSGELFFIADFDNWWNLYRVKPDGSPEKLLDMGAEFAVPDWYLGNHNYAFESDSKIVAGYMSKGITSLIRIDIDTGTFESIAAEFAQVKQVIKAADGIYFIGNKVTPEKGIYRVVGRGVEWVYEPKIPVMKPDFISRSETISCPLDQSKQTVYGYFYGPMNPHFISPNDQRPPLIIMLHGGPTASASLSFRRDIQFWTSRGFAVLDLNYRGSSGFGREYRQSLYGLWGQADVEDAVQAANYLVERGWVDGDKLAIRGTSAGGFTVLSALAFYDTFKAGVVYSGISDLDSLDKNTHKFELGYLDQLVGDLKPGSALYRERSPLYHLDDLKEPLLLIHGMQDLLVPPMQSLAIFNAVKQRGVPTALLRFEDEGHGLQKPRNQIAALEAELSFYGQVFGFVPSGNIPKLMLENSESLPSMTKH